MRQVVLDTETTGLDPLDGHRIIEIGCVELINRRLTGNDFHHYLNPDREIDQGAIDVHGITNEKLQDKPRFAAIVDDFLKYIAGAELIIHNAPFDIGFLDNELNLLGRSDVRIAKVAQVLDTLVIARQMHPGQRNSLDALCKRYSIDNSRRDYHGALLDAQILADVYLAMTGGQAALSLGHETAEQKSAGKSGVRLRRDGMVLAMPQPHADEAALHKELLQTIGKAGDSAVLWQEYDD